MKRLLLSLLLAATAHATISLGANNVCVTGLPSSTPSCTLTGITAGSGIVVFVIADNSTLIQSVSDGTNTYNLIGPNLISWNFQTRVEAGYYAENAAAGSITLTAQLANSASYSILFLAEVKGGRPYQILDQQQATTTLACGGGCIVSPTLSTTRADEAIFAVGCPSTTGSFVAGSGFTMITFAGTPNISCAFEYQVLSAIGNYTAPLTFGSTYGAGGEIAASFVAAPTSFVTRRINTIW